jgi:hypothetical protein
LLEKKCTLHRALRERPEADTVGVEHRALLQVEPGQAHQAMALHAQVDAPAPAVDMHELHGRLAEFASAVEDLVGRDERLQRYRLRGATAAVDE